MKNIRYLARFVALLIILTLVSIISFVLVSGQEAGPWADPEAVQFENPMYLPLVITTPNTIYGRVTDGGEPAIDVEVGLRLFDGVAWTTILTKTTNLHGEYGFSGISPLSAGQQYRVQYQNPGDDVARLWTWETYVLTSFANNSVAYIGDMDIANLELGAPGHLAMVTVPRTFSWTPRPASPTDSYEFQLFDYNDSNPSRLELLGHASSYNLTSLPAGFLNCITYAWGVKIYGPGGGQGLPFWYNAVTFYPTTPSGIHGCVAESGVPKSGIPVVLYRFNSSTQVDEELATTNTNASGYFAFTGRPALGATEAYFVKYQNSGSETNRLWNWYTRAIDTYIASSSVHIGDFDIANVALVAPADGSTVNLPETFSWTPRPGLQADSYEFNLYEDCDPPRQDCPAWYTDPRLGYVGQYTLTSMPANFLFNTQYWWEIWTYSPYDSAYGLSYQAFAVTFSPTAMSITPSRTTTEAQRQWRGLERMLHDKQVKSASQPGLRPVFERPPGQE